MLGQIVYRTGGRGRIEPGRLGGLAVLRCAVDPESRWLSSRLGRGASRLARSGVRRVLVPEGFRRWDLLVPWGLSGVDPVLLVTAMAAPLALAALKRGGIDPGGATVALLGRRTAGDLSRTACLLAPRVRRLVLPQGREGEELSLRLGEEFGMPALPPGTAAQVALSFSPECPGEEGNTLRLWQGEAGLDGLTLVLMAGEKGENWDLCTLCALWQRGKLELRDLKVLDKGGQKNL